MVRIHCLSKRYFQKIQQRILNIPVPAKSLLPLFWKVKFPHYLGNIAASPICEAERNPFSPKDLISLEKSLGGVLLHSKEEGGKNSSPYFIKYLSRLIMLKMYRKCTNAPFAPFLMLEMLKHCLAWAWHPKFQSKEEFPFRFMELILMPTQKIFIKYFLWDKMQKQISKFSGHTYTFLA